MTSNKKRFWVHCFNKKGKRLLGSSFCQIYNYVKPETALKNFMNQHWPTMLDSEKKRVFKIKVEWEKKKFSEYKTELVKTIKHLNSYTCLYQIDGKDKEFNTKAESFSIAKNEFEDQLPTGVIIEEFVWRENGKTLFDKSQLKSN